MAEFDAFPDGDIEATLDGEPVDIPAERRSFLGIRSLLEATALERQRLLCGIKLDGEPVNLAQARPLRGAFARVEGETMSLSEVPVQLLNAALQQAGDVRERVRGGVGVILINEARQARELWWNLSVALKEPLLTLSLLPESRCVPPRAGASAQQLRKWQLQQLGFVIRDVDRACESGDPAAMAEAIETRVLPWLDKLHESLLFWRDAMSGSRPARQGAGAA